MRRLMFRYKNVIALILVVCMCLNFEILSVMAYEKPMFTVPEMEVIENVEMELDELDLIQRELETLRSENESLKTDISEKDETINKLENELKKEQEKRKEESKWRKLSGGYLCTFYWPGEDSWGYQTATGVRSKHLKTCAVDPRIIPLGSEIKVVLDNGNTYILQAVDTGGAVKGNVIDIFVESPRYEKWSGVAVYINTEK